MNTINNLEVQGFYEETSITSQKYGEIPVKSMGSNIAKSIMAVFGLLGAVGVYRYIQEDDLDTPGENPTETLQVTHPIPTDPMPSPTLFTGPSTPKTFPHKEIFHSRFIQNTFSVNIDDHNPAAFSSHRGVSEVKLEKKKGEVVGRAYLSLSKEKSTKVLVQLETLNLQDILQIKKLFESWRSCDFFYKDESLSTPSSPIFQDKPLKKTNQSFQHSILDATCLHSIDNYLNTLNLTARDFFDKKGKRLITLKDSKQSPLAEVFFEAQKGGKPKVTINLIQGHDLDFLSLRKMLSGTFFKKAKSVEVQLKGHLLKGL